MNPQPFTLRPAEPRDVPAIVGLIGELADFEKLTHLMQVTPQTLHPHAEIAPAALPYPAVHGSQRKATRPARRFAVSPRMAVITRRSCGDSAS